MKNLIAILIILLIPLACQNSATTKDSSKESVKIAAGSMQESVVAGKFYPGDLGELKATIDGYLRAAGNKVINGDLTGIIVPHAGYPYSGPVAAYGFKELAGRDYDYAVVIAPSHHKKIDGAATRLVSSFETPLGKIDVATDIVKEMVSRYEWIIDDTDAFAKEHSLEVELPFLQMVQKGIQLIPLIVGTHDVDTLTKIAGSLNEVFEGKKVIYIISTDLSHYHPYKEAAAMDKKTVDLVIGDKLNELVEKVATGECEMCGFGPVVVMMQLFNMTGGGKIELLKYANSGDTSGEKARGVVGYSSIAFLNGFNLTENQKKELTGLAWKTIRDTLDGKRITPVKLSDPYLMKNGAAFVTLKKNGELRGCIGHIIAREPLALSVQNNAVSAALRDPRFSPVKKEELKDISLEVSVLTPPQPVYDPSTIKVGRDGLIIENGMHRGVLLPQVPGEWNWNLNDYLEAICRKAGLPASAIKDPKTKLYRFQALVF